MIRLPAANALALGTRAGLPEDLRVLVAKYPRDTWQGHPNFDGLTAFWLDRHGMFRQVMGRLTTQSETVLDSQEDQRHALHRYTGFFLDQLHGHHQIEDAHYFPQLIGLDGRVARGFDLLETDHAAIDGHLQALAQATNAVLQSGDLTAMHDSWGRLYQAQIGMAALLERHLADEEDIVVPVILEHAPALQ